jgi:hypothetical protein
MSTSLQGYFSVRGDHNVEIFLRSHLLSAATTGPPLAPFSRVTNPYVFLCAKPSCYCRLLYSCLSVSFFVLQVVKTIGARVADLVRIPEHQAELMQVMPPSTGVSPLRMDRADSDIP